MTGKSYSRILEILFFPYDNIKLVEDNDPKYTFKMAKQWKNIRGMLLT